MTVVLSTSSPQASVALFDAEGAILGEQTLDAPMAASGACLTMLHELLEENWIDIHSLNLLVSDVGPGSFTGVKVGVTLAKTMAFAIGAYVGAVSSFDLISDSETVVVPSRKGEWFVRVPGQPPERVTELPPGACVGYGPGFESPCLPLASRAQALLANIEPMKPELLIPNYIAEPSISTPKQAYPELNSEARLA